MNDKSYFVRLASVLIKDAMLPNLVAWFYFNKQFFWSCSLL